MAPPHDDDDQDDDKPMNPTDETLSAYLDDELDADARARLEALLAGDAAARERLQAMADSDARLRAAMPLGRAEADPLAALIMGSAAPSPSGALPSRQHQPRPALRRRRRLASLMAMAAGLGAIVLGQALLTSPGGGGETAAPWQQADGDWQAALDRQPSGATGTTRVALSFTAGDGRPCRLFSQPAGEGLACRSPADAGWQVLAWDATALQTAGDSGYQPAGASSALDAAMNRLGGGDALSLEQERELIDRHWRASAR